MRTSRWARKSAYAVGNDTLRSGVWTFDNALIGDQFNDRVSQIKSARIRNAGFIAMNFDKPGGAGVVTLQAALYGSDPANSVTLEYSTNGGTSYTAVPATGGAPVLTTTLTTYGFVVNQTGNVRLRISNPAAAGANARINVDDVNIPGYTGSATRAGQALAGLALYPNPAHDRLTVVLPTTGAATVALRDLTGRVVLAPGRAGRQRHTGSARRAARRRVPAGSAAEWRTCRAPHHQGVGAEVVAFRNGKKSPGRLAGGLFFGCRSAAGCTIFSG